jgi:hypothetical protein
VQRRGLRSLAVATLACAACGNVRVEDLKRPTYVWDAEDGLCGRSVAVDGARLVWREHGCESNPSLKLVGLATPAEVRALSEGFVSLRAFDPTMAPSGGFGITHLFQEYPVDQPPFALAIRAPDDARSFDEVDSLIEPFGSLARAFLQLP